MSVRRPIRNHRRDAAIFKRTARKTEAKNIPGRVVQRGGIRL